MGFRYIQKTIRQLQGGLLPDHYHDLKYCSLTLFNAIVEELRCGSLSDSWIDIVVNASTVMKETTLTRVQMQADVAQWKDALIHWHLNDTGKMLYRIPTRVDTFHRLRNKKSCKVKDCVIEIVTKLYRLHCEHELSESCGK